jgi:hypothetical protein
MSTAHIIALKTRGTFVKESALGSQDPYLAPVTPGMMLEYATATTVLPHSTAGALPAPLMFAVEMSVDGRGIDDKYDEAGEAVPHQTGLPGEEFYALLATGQNIAAGALLTSDGAGCFKANNGTAVARALESVNNSAGTAPARIRVEVL